MECRHVEIVNPTGLHTRPGTLFVKHAKSFASEIHIVKQDKRVNAKSLLTLMKAGISLGDTITIEAEGPDAATAVDELAQLIASLKE
jgi:phosphocarrier protein HPr